MVLTYTWNANPIKGSCFCKGEAARTSRKLLKKKSNEEDEFYQMLRPIIRLLLVAQTKEPASNGGDPGLIPAGEDPLEKGIATHSSTWKTSWTEEPDGLQSIGSQRVGTQLSD